MMGYEKQGEIYRISRNVRKHLDNVGNNITFNELLDKWSDLYWKAIDNNPRNAYVQVIRISLAIMREVTEERIYWWKLIVMATRKRNEK